ncbi:MAG: hypothetical protein ABIU38_20005 [Vicinamibacteraceae bacterium]
MPDLTSRTPGIAPDPSWDTFSADVTIRRRMVKRDGTPGPDAPEMRYRWVRTLGDTGWKTTMTVLSVAPRAVVTAQGARLVPANAPMSRIEIGDARTPTRIYDAAGQLLFMLPSQPRPAVDADPLTALLAGLRRGSATNVRPMDAIDAVGLTAPLDTTDRSRDPRSRQWIEHILPNIAGRADRRGALTRRLGAPQGTVRGLERYVTASSDATTEVLTDPSWSVPVEINVAREGRLVSHSAVSYQEDPGAGLVRRRIRSEQLMSVESGDRASADVEFTNIRLDRGGVR